MTVDGKLADRFNEIKHYYQIQSDIDLVKPLMTQAFERIKRIPVEQRRSARFSQPAREERKLHMLRAVSRIRWKSVSYVEWENLQLCLPEMFWSCIVAKTVHA
jgi:hypothetical protein